MARDIDRPRGQVDVQAGTVTDLDTGEVFLFRDWACHVDKVQQDRLREALELRDKRSDAQNLPGNKPWFQDDWMGYFPAVTGNKGKYPAELGFEGPWVPTRDRPQEPELPES